MDVIEFNKSLTSLNFRKGPSLNFSQTGYDKIKFRCFEYRFDYFLIIFHGQSSGQGCDSHFVDYNLYSASSPFANDMSHRKYASSVKLETLNIGQS